MADVFLSYAVSDQDFAERLAKSLGQRGVEVWLSKHDVGAGDDWLASLRHRLDDAWAFVLVMPGAHAAKGNNTFFEAGAARAIGKEVVVVVPDLNGVDRDNIPIDLAKVVIDAGKQSVETVASTVLTAIAPQRNCFRA